MESKIIFTALLLLISFRNSLQDQAEGELDTLLYDPSPRRALPDDCSEIQQRGYASGKYVVLPLHADNVINVYCDFDSYGGKWTVIQQRRGPEANSAFAQDFERYKGGFDDVKDNLWIGLDALHELTVNKKYELLIELQDLYNVKQTINYKIFQVASGDNNYRLKIGNYTGTAGDILEPHNQKPFITSDSSATDIGGGCQKYTGHWWGEKCKDSNLNGVNLVDGNHFKATKMMIRPLSSMDPNELCASKLQMSGLSDRVAELHICSCNQRKDDIRKLSELTSNINKDNFMYIENRFKDVEEAIGALNFNDTILKNTNRIEKAEKSIIKTISGELQGRFAQIENMGSYYNKDVATRLNDLNALVTKLVSKPTDERIKQLEAALDKDLQEVVNALDNVRTTIKELKPDDLRDRLNAISSAISQIGAKELQERFNDLSSLVNQRNNEFINRFNGVDEAVKKLDCKDAHKKHGDRLDEIENNLSKLISTELDKRFEKVETASHLRNRDLNRKVDNIENSLATILSSELNKRFNEKEAADQLKDNNLNQKLNEVKAILSGLDVKPTDEKIRKLENQITQLVKQNEELITKIEKKANENPPKVIPEDCGQLTTCEPGMHYIQPRGMSRTINVYCQRNKWTTIQRRINGEVDFFRSFIEYENGFGNIDGEYWLGLENIYQMTRHGQYELYIEMTDFDNNKKFARYSTFYITSPADGYRLKVAGYSGTAGDSLEHSNNHKFSTRDRDFDSSTYNCAVLYKGAWWYNRCHYSNLNGKYILTGTSRNADDDSAGLVWSTWKGFKYSMKTTRMMIRRKDDLSQKCGV